jgi:hypothetical protein
MFFHSTLLDDRRIWIRIREAQKHVDPTDPDPQHWFRYYMRSGSGLRLSANKELHLD